MPKQAVPAATPEAFLPLTATVFSILLSLSGGDKHGYAIMKEAASDGGGSITMGPGTLYGSLDRMAQNGLVEETGTTDDERRRYYRITAFGRKVLGAESLRLKRALASLSGRRVLSNGGEA